VETPLFSIDANLRRIKNAVLKSFLAYDYG